MSTPRLGERHLDFPLIWRSSLSFENPNLVSWRISQPLSPEAVLSSARAWPHARSHQLIGIVWICCYCCSVGSSDWLCPLSVNIPLIPDSHPLRCPLTGAQLLSISLQGCCVWPSIVHTPNILHLLMLSILGPLNCHEGLIHLEQMGSVHKLALYMVHGLVFLPRGKVHPPENVRCLPDVATLESMPSLISLALASIPLQSSICCPPCNLCNPLHNADSGAWLSCIICMGLHGLQLSAWHPWFGLVQPWFGCQFGSISSGREFD